MILSYIVILRRHDNRYRIEIFSIVISAAQYLSSIHEIYCSKTFKFYNTSKIFHPTFAILVLVIL